MSCDPPPPPPLPVHHPLSPKVSNSGEKNNPKQTSPFMLFQNLGANDSEMGLQMMYNNRGGTYIP